MALRIDFAGDSSRSSLSFVPSLVAIVRLASQVYPEVFGRIVRTRLDGAIRLCNVWLLPKKRIVCTPVCHVWLKPV